MISSHDEYITIFGVNEENLEYIDKLFSEYNPIYSGANYSDEVIWNRSLKFTNRNGDILSKESSLSASDKKTDDDSINGEFHPNPIQFFSKSNDIREAFLRSHGNWIYARFTSNDFIQIQKDRILQSKCILNNDDIIYCMKGIYQGEDNISELPKMEEIENQNTKIVEESIYKMSKIENLTDLSFEGKTFNIKFNEFIIGNYKISREQEIAKENASGSREFILTVSLIIFFVIFIYKISK